MAIKLTADQVFPPDGTAVLVSTRPNALYGEDSKPTGEIDGIRCDVRALPDLAPVSVKVPGAVAPLPNEDIEALAMTGHLTWVSFDKFKGTQWVDRKTGTIKVSGTAEGVKIASAPDDDTFSIE